MAAGRTAAPSEDADKPKVAAGRTAAPCAAYLGRCCRHAEAQVFRTPWPRVLELNFDTDSARVEPKHINRRSAAAHGIHFSTGSKLAVFPVQFGFQIPITATQRVRLQAKSELRDGGLKQKTATL